MPRHACIFCTKSYNRLPEAQVPVISPIRGRSAVIRRTAVPVFLGRVSPVLDTCTQLFMLDAGGKAETVGQAIPMKGSSIFERAREIQGLGIGVIICGAVSDSFYNLLREADIDLVCGITGDIDDVIKAYRNGTLEQPRFRMPGAD